jgi:RimJ/RimL family protein N-acetyltransferase
MTMSSFPSLETGRLLLRRFEMADAAITQKLLDDPEVVGNLIDKVLPYSLADAEALIKRSHQAFASGEAYVYAVVRKSNADLVGYCDIELKPGTRDGEIAYWIGRPYWWQGYATEAAKCLVQFGFETLGLERVYAYVLKRNRRSAHVLEKAGLSLEATREKSAYKDGVDEDVELYGLLRGTYAANQN